MPDASPGGREAPDVAAVCGSADGVYQPRATNAFADRHGLGFAGVGFFFVLSGFILTYTYHRDFDARLTWQRVRSIYVARFARIYPVHFVTTMIALFSVTVFGVLREP